MTKCTVYCLLTLLVEGFCMPADAQTAPAGYARAVTDPVAVHAAAARFQADLRALGLPASVEDCRLAEAVAVGVRNGEIAYGAACRIQIGTQPAKEFVICDSDLSGFGALYSGSFVDNPEWMASFIRKNCF